MKSVMQPKQVGILFEEYIRKFDSNSEWTDMIANYDSGIMEAFHLYKTSTNFIQPWTMCLSKIESTHYQLPLNFFQHRIKIKDTQYPTQTNSKNVS